MSSKLSSTVQIFRSPLKDYQDILEDYQSRILKNDDHVPESTEATHKFAVSLLNYPRIRHIASGKMIDYVRNHDHTCLSSTVKLYKEHASHVELLGCKSIYSELCASFQPEAAAALSLQYLFVSRLKKMVSVKKQYRENKVSESKETDSEELLKQKTQYKIDMLNISNQLWPELIPPGTLQPGMDLNQLKSAWKQLVGRIRYFKELVDEQKNSRNAEKSRLSRNS